MKTAKELYFEFNGFSKELLTIDDEEEVEAIRHTLRIGWTAGAEAMREKMAKRANENRITPDELDVLCEPLPPFPEQP